MRRSERLSYKKKGNIYLGNESTLEAKFDKNKIFNSQNKIFYCFSEKISKIILWIKRKTLNLQQKIKPDRADTRKQLKHILL